MLANKNGLLSITTLSDFTGPTNGPADDHIFGLIALAELADFQCKHEQKRYADIFPNIYTWGLVFNCKPESVHSSGLRAHNYAEVNIFTLIYVI